MKPVSEAARSAAGGVEGAWAAGLAHHRKHLWGLCYRMTGSAADADDLVQETFRRALESPPPDLARDPRPWLVRVAVNLSRDALRARRLRGYDGTWLPSPIETPEGADLPTPPAQGAEARYGQLESLTFAFLLALETLTASQRAVLMLRDVFDYSVDETAVALDLSPANVKTTLHRARRVLAGQPRSNSPTPDLVRRTRKALEAFCMHLAAGNVAALESLLAQDVRTRNDSNGEFFAAKKPIVGVAKVIKFYLYTVRRGRMRYALRSINGLPALVVETPAPGDPRIARRLVIRVELDSRDRIATIDAVVANEKLGAIDFDGLTEPTFADFVRPIASALSTPPLRTWLPRAVRRVAGALVRRGQRALRGGST